MTSIVPHEDITYKVIGAAMRVHNENGPGLKEVMYHRGMSAALENEGLSFEEEKAFEVRLEDGTFAGLIYLDHYVEDAVVVEIKAFPHLLTKAEMAQVITYLAISKAKVGLLLNFGRNRLEYQRILPPKKFEDWRARAARLAWKPAEARAAEPSVAPLRLSAFYPLTATGAL